MSDTPSSHAARHHASPHLGLVAVIFTVLFLAGLYPVTAFGGLPYFPGPWEPPDVIINFFRAKPGAVLACAFFHFGAAIVLGIFTASIVSRLHPVPRIYLVDCRRVCTAEDHRRSNQTAARSGDVRP